MLSYRLCFCCCNCFLVVLVLVLVLFFFSQPERMNGRKKIDKWINTWISCAVSNFACIYPLPVVVVWNRRFCCCSWCRCRCRCHWFRLLSCIGDISGMKSTSGGAACVVVVIVLSLLLLSLPTDEFIYTKVLQYM